MKIQTKSVLLALGFAVSFSLFSHSVQAQSAGAIAGASSSSGASANSAAGAVGVAHGGSGGSASANNAGNNQIIQYNTEAADLGDAVAPAFAPALTTTLSDTCMGSTSGGLGVSGGGISFGSTWSDEECVRRLHARQLGAWGQAMLAVEIMCASPHVLEADKRLADMGETPHCSANAAKPKDGETAYIRIYPLNPELTAFNDDGGQPLYVDELQLGAVAAKR